MRGPLAREGNTKSHNSHRLVRAYQLCSFWCRLCCSCWQFRYGGGDEHDWKLPTTQLARTLISVKLTVIDYMTVHGRGKAKRHCVLHARTK